MAGWWTITLIGSLFIMMCALASAVDIKSFFNKLKKPKGIFIGLVCQYGFLPAIAFGLCYLFDFDYQTSVALILTATCPGGILSNFFAFTIGADLPLSIAMTTTSSLLSFGFIPLNSFLYIKLGLNASGVQIDWGGLMFSILVLIAGVFVGLIFAWRKVTIAQRILGPLATLCLIYLVVVSLYDNFTSEYPLWTLDWTYYIAPLILTTIGWISGLAFALLWKMPKSSAVAVGIETSNQSTGVAIAILALSITDRDTYFRVVAVPGIYTLLTWMVNGIFVVLFLKLGWVDEDRDGDESITCCTLIKKYKKRVHQEKKYEYQYDEEQEGKDLRDNETSASGSIKVELKNMDEFDGLHQTNIVVEDKSEDEQNDTNENAMFISEGEKSAVLV